MLPALLPLFPLPRVVLFPHGFLPLHIFEMRYRQMTAESLATHQHFIMALTRTHEGTDLVPASAPVFETGCLARILKAEPMADGRFNLLVQGRWAVRIKEEPSPRSFRQAKWEAIPFEPRIPPEQSLTSALLASLDRYASRFAIESEVGQLLNLELSPVVLLNTLCMALDLDPVEKQFLLESTSLGQMEERLLQVLEFALSGRNIRGSPS